MLLKEALFLGYVLLLYHVSEISSSRFEKLISTTHFVDKTAMIKTVFENCKNTPYMMITCPKLFGKSINLDMIKKFSEMDISSGIVTEKKESSSYKLFTNTSLKISQHKYLIEEHLAEYPVILLNMSFSAMQMENLTIEKILREICSALKESIKSYQWLLLDRLTAENLIEKNSLIEEQITFLKKILQKNLNEDEITESLLQLSEILYTYFQKKVIILIDDYDIVINEAMFTPNFDSDRIINVVQKMICKLLEHKNSYVEFAIITGVNGILYNFYFQNTKTISHHRFLSCPLFSFYFGFTNEDVNQLLQRLQTDQQHEIEKYYNGYTALGNLPVRTITEKTIFNPYSVTSYLINTMNATERSSNTFGYWTATKLVAKFLEKFMKASEFRKFILELLHEKIIYVKHMHNNYGNELVAFKNLVDRDFDDIGSFDVLTFLALMFEYGYLSYTHKINFYRIPNQEVKKDIEKYLSTWYEEHVNITKLELKSINDSISDIIKSEAVCDHEWNKFIRTASQVFQMMVHNYSDYMPKRGGLPFELRSILYLAVAENEAVEIGEMLERDFYDSYPDTAKLVIVNHKGIALIILIMQEDNETLQEAVKYVKTNKLNVKQTITYKLILSINLLRDVTWETEYEVLNLPRGNAW